MKKLFRISSGLCALALLVNACNGATSIDPVVAEKAELTGLSFDAADNPGLSLGCYSRTANGYRFVTVPEGINLNGLAANISVSDGASIYDESGNKIDSKYRSDFSTVRSITVKSSSGKLKNTYKICVKNGDTGIDNSVYEFMGKYSIPGISVSVMKNEKVIYSTGYGFAVKENEERVTPDHLFRLASISKQFTTLCIMTLYERGLLSIDDHVFGKGGILDAQFPGVTGQKATITVRNFLQHNAGFPTSPDPMFSSIRDGKTIDDLINYVLAQDLKTNPGSTYAYYNMGFGILGRVVEVVSGMPYETFLKEEVLKPMGITDIHVGGGSSERRRNECVYYSQDGTNGYGNPMKVIAAAGGIIASTNQMMKVLASIDGRDEVPDILKPETLKLMYNSPTSNYSRYSLGWRINHSLFPGAHYHTGNLAGTATMWVGDSNGMSIALLCNSRSYIDGFDDATYMLVYDIINHFKSKN